MSKQALIVWGGWDGHTPRECAGIFADHLAGAGYDVNVRDTLDAYLDEQLMASLDLILPIWTMGRITDEQWAGLSKAVYHGCGYAGFHGGIIDSFRMNNDYQFMTGGQFVGHPGNCIPEYTVRVTDSAHPITEGVNDFVMRDTEQYYCHVDPGVHVLCTTTFTGEHGDASLYEAGTVMPFAWTRQWGEGKVFVAAWGHTHRDFDVPEARQIVDRGLQWATR
jgi:type 1 glutamine amidotransferase